MTLGRLSYLLTVVLGVAAAVAGTAAVLGAVTWSVTLRSVLPPAGLMLRLDPLAGTFLLIVGIGATLAAVYALGYAPDGEGGSICLVFVGAMAMVPLAGNAWTFLLAWEVMSLASYVLVVAGGGRRENVQAGWVYFVMTHAGFACLLIGMLILAVAHGDFAFAAWATGASRLSPRTTTVAFAFLAVAFLSKAGVMPLHVWLPRAHPAAPSHVSALMSGVMIKLGLYGLLRAAFEWTPVPAAWGGVILAAGAVSAVLGVLYALVDGDLKRVLAFSSIENVGIMLLGVGTAMAAHALGAPVVAVLALTAALFHALNHAVFKSLLFLAAGSVVHAAGSRQLDLLGGLVKRMPWTSACFLTGAVAIAGLPPLNGFVSEWLTFQAMLGAVGLPHPLYAVLFATAIAVLALTAGLATACFVRAFGATFLALPRSDAGGHAHEAGPAMRLAMAAGAAACAGIALAAGPILRALTAVAAATVRADTPEFGSWLTIEMPRDFASLSMPMLAIALAVAVAGVHAALLVLRARRGRRLGETWGCGRLLQTARMEYTATAFASPFTRVFDFLYRPRKRLEIDVHPDSRFFITRITWANPTRSVIDDWLYRPLLDGLHGAAQVARRIQSGSANLYLVYILAALLVLLLVA